MKKLYIHPEISFEEMEEDNLLDAFSGTDTYNGSGNGGSGSDSDSGPGLGGDDDEAAAKSSAWTVLDYDYEIPD